MDDVEPPQLTIVRPGEGRAGTLGSIGVVFKLFGADTGGQLSIVEHPFPVGAFVPPHKHTREDEYSIVTEGEIGFRSGGREVVLGPGGYLTKPRGELHAIVERVISTWEDRVAVTLEQTYGPSEGKRLYTRYIRNESRSGIYRESTKPDDVPEDLRRLEIIEAQIETYVRGLTADSAVLSIYSPRPLGLTAGNHRNILAIDAAHRDAAAHQRDIDQRRLRRIAQRHGDAIIARLLRERDRRANQHHQSDDMTNCHCVFPPARRARTLPLSVSNVICGPPLPTRTRVNSLAR